MTTEDLMKLLDDFPEINPSNYGDDEVNALNAWGIAAHTALEALGREVAELKADLKHTEECCTGWAGDFGKANKELEALRAELEAIRAQEPIGCGYVVKWERGDTPSTYETGYAQVLGISVYASPVAKDAGLVADGWKLVPVEPTEEMVRASFHLDLSYMPGQEGVDRAAIYRAMLAASPKIGGV